MAAKLQAAASQGDLPVRSARRLRRAGGFRDEYPGGVIHLFRFLLRSTPPRISSKGQPKPLPPEREKLWQEAMANPDYRMYPHVYNVLTQKGQHFPRLFRGADQPVRQRRGGQEERGRIRQDQDPDLHRLGLVRLHVQDASASARRTGIATSIRRRRSCCSLGPAHLDRPFKAFHDEILRWYDHWLKGIDTGIMNEPPVRFWVHGREQVAQRQRLAAAGDRSGPSSTCTAGSG